MPTDNKKEEDEGSLILKVAQTRRRAMEKLLSNNVDTESADSKEAVRKYKEEIDNLKALVSEKDYQLRELNYELKSLRKKESEREESAKLLEAKHRAKINQTETLLAELEDKVLTKDESVRRSRDKLLQLFQTLEKHTQYGRHSVPSTTFIGLLSSIRQVLNSLSTASSNQVLSTSNERSASNNTPEIGTVEHTLLEMCRGLEEDNTKIQLEKAEIVKELDLIRKESIDQSNLIPRYRLAILRERATAREALDRVSQAKQQVEALQNQLAQANDDMEQMGLMLEEEKHKNRRILLEKNAIMSELEPLLLYKPTYAENFGAAKSYAAAKEPTTEKEPNSKKSSVGGVGKVPRSVNANQKEYNLFKSLSSQEKNEKVRVVKSEIAALEENIDDLKEKLKSAALRQTKEIVGNIVGRKIS